jgi:hypothetical protein
MSLVCGIYGYEVTRPFEIDGLKFLPLVSDLHEAKKLARDLDRSNLTGVVIADEFPGDLLFCLEAVLSFIEHLDVVVTEPVRIVGSDHFANFAPVAQAPRRSNGGGAVLRSDAVFPSSRPKFIALALARLADRAHCEATGYRLLFLKATETFRQRKPFLEVSYFFLFSGLETYVRRTLGQPTERDVAQLMFLKLKSLGFNVLKFQPDQLERSTDTYARLRNALFHNSDFKASRRHGGRTIRYALVDYYAQFMILVSLVVLKATDFDDGHINWDGWIDRRLFK